MAEISGIGGAAGIDKFMALSKLGSLNSTGAASSSSGVGGLIDIEEGQEKSSFSDILFDSIENSESLNDTTAVDTFSLLSGNTDHISDVLINAKKSELAVNLTVQLRNKAMDAYKEIMNMQV
jgi:flagellar hook-basal body complex protein FliE